MIEKEISPDNRIRRHLYILLYIGSTIFLLFRQQLDDYIICWYIALPSAQVLQAHTSQISQDMSPTCTPEAHHCLKVGEHHTNDIQYCVLLFQSISWCLWKFVIYQISFSILGYPNIVMKTALSVCLLFSS